MVDLDKEYSPSQWNKRFPSAEAVLENFISVGKNEYDKSVSSIDCELNVRYGDSVRQKIDIFGTNLPAGAPVFVFIHGGYWQMNANEASGFPIRTLVANNIKVMLLEYDLCPDVTLEDIIIQIKKGAKYIFDYCKKNMSRGLSFAGHSAGAHLLAYLLHQSFIDEVGNDDYFKLLKSLYFISGVYDVTEARNVKSVNDKNILSITDVNEKYLSPLFHDFSHLKECKIKGHVYVGGYEPPIFQNQAEKFFEHLTFTARMSEMDFEIFLKYDHFDIIEELTNADYKMTKLIISELNS